MEMSTMDLKKRNARLLESEQEILLMRCVFRFLTFSSLERTDTSPALLRTATRFSMRCSTIFGVRSLACTGVRRRWRCWICWLRAFPPSSSSPLHRPLFFPVLPSPESRLFTFLVLPASLRTFHLHSFADVSGRNDYGALSLPSSSLPHPSFQKGRHADVFPIQSPPRMDRHPRYQGWSSPAARAV
jgi:hypothetical protein